MLTESEITSRELHKRTKTHKGNVTHWAMKAGVKPIRLESNGGHVVQVWPRMAVDLINQARKESNRT